MAEAARSLTCPPQTLAPYAEISAHGAPISPTVQIFKSKLCHTLVIGMTSNGTSKEAHCSVEADERVPEQTGSYEPTGSEPTGSYLPENAKHSRPAKSGSFLKEYPFGATALSRSLNTIRVRDWGQR